jgi:hypothetical protein
MNPFFAPRQLVSPPFSALFSRPSSLTFLSPFLAQSFYQGHDLFLPEPDE